MPAKTVIDVDGTDAVSKVLITLLNTFPGLTSGMSVQFATLEDKSGIGFFPTSGAALLKDTESITGHVSQVCLYTFNVIYRAAPKTEAQRMRIKEFLDMLGKWLEKQEIKIGTSVYQIQDYPPLTSGNRKIKSITRSSAAYLYAANQDKVEDWLITIQLKYDNEFDK